MLLLTLLLSLALAAFFTLLPARVLHRRTTRADLAVGGLCLVQARVDRRL